MNKINRKTMGILIISILLITLIMMLCTIFSGINVDFPCESSLGGPAPNINKNTRIAYCISDFPLYSSGGYVYDVGSSETNEINTEFGHLQRQDQILLVNDIAIKRDENYIFTKWGISINPWIIIKKDITINNLGIRKYQDQDNEGYLYAVIDLNEKWFINPICIIILLFGIYLWVSGIKIQKHQK